jgi:hypothetical protein
MKTNLYHFVIPAPDRADTWLVVYEVPGAGTLNIVTECRTAADAQRFAEEKNKALNPTWREIGRNLMTYTEPQLQEMIELELDSLRRVRVVERLHQRFCALRDNRERQELFARLKP